jgi:hypothetical protein
MQEAAMEVQELLRDVLKMRWWLRRRRRKRRRKKRRKRRRGNRSGSLLKKGSVMACKATRVCVSGGQTWSRP